MSTQSVITEFPTSFTDAKRALRTTRSSPPGDRRVYLSHGVEPRGAYRSGLTYGVTGPTADGEVLTVVVGSGLLPLRILSGNVRVELASDWGNVCTVMPEARETTTVHVAGCKATVYGVDADRLTGNLYRTRVHPLSADHRLPVST